MKVRYTICYLGSIMIMELYYDNWSILCRQGTQYAALVVL